MMNRLADQAGLAGADTFPRFLRACAATFGAQPAIRLAGESLPDDEISFAGLESRSAGLARRLLAEGAGKGARIGFICGNGPAFAVILAAIARIGAIAIPVSTLARGAELVRILRQSDMAGLIVQPRLLGRDLIGRLGDALPGLGAGPSPDLRLAEVPHLRWVASWGQGLPGWVRPLESLGLTRAPVDADLLRAVEAEVHATDQMVEIYTSGSMAAPKGVAHCHGPVLARVRFMAAMVEREAGSEARVPLPMFWVGGLGLGLLVNLASGVTSLCSEGTSTSSGAARGSVFSAEELKARSQARPFWSLGMTETFGPYSWGDDLRAPGQPLAPPIDHLAEGFELRVVDDAGQPVGEGETGEIQVRGHGLAPRLHKFDRAEHFTPDGFYRTGDLGLVEAGRIHFRGRGGDMIKTAKANVSPAEVEMELARIDGVAAAFVVGLPDAERGQIVAAAVVAHDGAVPDFAAIEAELRDRMAGYKVPRAFVALASDDVPMLPSNKVARRDLVNLLCRRLGREDLSGAAQA